MLGVHSVKQQTCNVSGCAAPLSKQDIVRGMRLCGPCRKLLATRLADLPQMYQACEDALEVHHQNPIPTIRGHRPTGIHLDDETVTVRSDTVGVLSSWCEMIVEECGVIGPRSLAVRKLASFLRGHLDWLAAHVVAADFAEEIAGLVQSVRRVLNPSHVRTADLVPCPRDGCGRMVRVRIVQDRSQPQVHCDAGHTWHPRQWLDLRNQVDRANSDAFA